MKGAILILILLTIIVGCDSSLEYQNNQKPIEQVTVMLKWLHQAQFAGNYVAVEEGFYEDNGLNVSILPFGFKKSPINSVADGDAEFGIAGAEEVILERSKGKPVKTVAVIFRTNPACFYTLKNSGIEKPTDFIGKTVGIERNGDGSDINVGYLYYAMMGKLGINRSQINEVNIGYDGSELTSGDVDVATGYNINEPDYAVKKGYDVNVVLMAEYGVNMYADVIITSDKILKERPGLVKSFVNATLAGWQYAIENEDSAVETTLKYAQDSNKEHQKYMLTQELPLIYNGETHIGWMDPKKWADAEQILTSQKVLQNPVNINETYTMEILNQIYSK